MTNLTLSEEIDLIVKIWLNSSRSFPRRILVKKQVEHLQCLQAEITHFMQGIKAKIRNNRQNPLTERTIVAWCSRSIIPIRRLKLSLARIKEKGQLNDISPLQTLAWHRLILKQNYTAWKAKRPAQGKMKNVMTCQMSSLSMNVSVKRIALCLTCQQINRMEAAEISLLKALLGSTSTTAVTKTWNSISEA